MQRAELIGGLINSIFLLSTAVFIIVEASKFIFNLKKVPKFFQPEKLEQSLSVLIIAAIGVAMNLAATVIFGGS
jgi:Co/Zn/Cd efflux system component